MKLSRFHLLGHCLGAYLTVLYTRKFSEHVSHLILVDPWGVPEKPDEDPRLKDATFTRKMIFSAASFISSPFSFLRVAGPIGPLLVDWARPDLAVKFQHLLSDKAVSTAYIYHCNAQDPSGDMAFSCLQIPVGWARDPVARHLPNLPEDIPVSIIFGKKTWMDVSTTLLIAKKMKPFVEIVLIPDAGHHVYIDNLPLFNQAIILCGNQKLCDMENVPDVNFTSKGKGVFQ